MAKPKKSETPAAPPPVDNEHVAAGAEQFSPETIAAAKAAAAEKTPTPPAPAKVDPIYDSRPTLAAHESGVAREAQRLKNTAEALKPEGRRRQGLSTEEQDRIVRRLRGELSWRDALGTLALEIDAGVLEGWRPHLEKRAKDGDGPVLPAKPPAAKEA